MYIDLGDHSENPIYREKQIEEKYRICTRVKINKRKYKLECNTGFICNRIVKVNDIYVEAEEIDFIIRLDNGNFISVKYNDYEIDRDSILTNHEKSFLRSLQKLCKKSYIRISNMDIYTSDDNFSIKYNEDGNLYAIKEIYDINLIDYSLLKLIEHKIDIQIVNSPKFLVHEFDKENTIIIPDYDDKIPIIPKKDTIVSFVQHLLDKGVKSIYLYSLLTGAESQNYYNNLDKFSIIKTKIDLNYMYIRYAEKRL